MHVSLDFQPPFFCLFHILTLHTPCPTYPSSIQMHGNPIWKITFITFPFWLIEICHRKSLHLQAVMSAKQTCLLRNKEHSHTWKYYLSVPLKSSSLGSSPWITEVKVSVYACMLRFNKHCRATAVFATDYPLQAWPQSPGLYLEDADKSAHKNRLQDEKSI